MAYGQPIGNLRKILKQFRNTGNVDHVQVADYIQDLITSIEDSANVESISDSEMTKLINKGMNNFSLAVLGLNPAVQMKQVVSVIAAVPELGWSVVRKNGKGMNAARKIIADSYAKTEIGIGKWQPGKLDLSNPTLQEIMDIVPSMKMRFSGLIDREQGDLRSTALNKFSGKTKGIKIGGREFHFEKNMEGIKIMDAAALGAIFEEVKEQMSQKYTYGSLEWRNAVRKKFEQVVNRTQPTFTQSTRNPFSRSRNNFIRLFTGTIIV